MEHIVCEGLDLGGIRIPEFVVNAGESICFMWPVNSKHTAVSQFNDLLWKGMSPNFKVTGTPCFAERLWWETRLFGINDHFRAQRYLPGSVINRLYRSGRMWELLVWQGKKIPIDAQLEERLAKFRSPAGILILESSDAKLVSCLLCEREADMTVFDQQRCSPGKLIGLMEQEDFHNTIIEHRYSDIRYTPDRTYKDARVIRFQLRQ